MIYYHKLLLSFAVLAINSAGSVFAQEINLDYNFTKDEKFLLTVHTQQLVEQDLDGFTQTIINLIESEILIKVAEVQGDSAKLEVAYQNLYFSMDGPMGEGMVMSSRGDRNDPINKVVRSMVNNPFYVYLNKFGKILSVEGMEVVLGKINESLDLIDEDLKESIQASIDNQFGEESFKSSFMTGLIAYPAKSIQVGDTWSSSMSDYSTVPLEMNTTWHLLNIKRNTAEIEGIATLQSKEKTIKGGDIEHIGLTGTNNIKATVNVATGWIQESTQTSEISGIMVLPPDQYFSESVEIPLKIKTVTRTVLK